MAYLRWSSSPWHAFSHIDGGDGDEALLAAWHVAGARLELSAGELRQAGCAGSPERVRALLARAPGIDAAALADANALAPAIDQFLFEIEFAGRIPMPTEVANRRRELWGWIEAAFAKPGDADSAAARVSTDTPALLQWVAEFGDINRRFPPPRPSREIRELVQLRALRAMRGEVVSPEQDARECERIAKASRWPAP